MTQEQESATVYFRDSGPAELHASLQSLGAHAVGKNDDGSRWQLACDDGRTLDIQVIDDSLRGGADVVAAQGQSATRGL